MLLAAADCDRHIDNALSFHNALRHEPVHLGFRIMLHESPDGRSVHIIEQENLLNLPDSLRRKALQHSKELQRVTVLAVHEDFRADGMKQELLDILLCLFAFPANLVVVAEGISVLSIQPDKELFITAQKVSALVSLELPVEEDIVRESDNILVVVQPRSFLRPVLRLGRERKHLTNILPWHPHREDILATLNTIRDFRRDSGSVFVQRTICFDDIKPVLAQCFGRCLCHIH